MGKFGFLSSFEKIGRSGDPGSAFLFVCLFKSQPFTGTDFSQLPLDDQRLP